jgi:hypothetical protein
VIPFLVAYEKLLGRLIIRAHIVGTKTRSGLCLVKALIFWIFTVDSRHLVPQLNSVSEPCHTCNDKFATICLLVTAPVPKGQGHDGEEKDNICSSMPS